MIKFSQFVTEASIQFEGWEDALRKSPMLAAGRDLLSDLERLQPESENLIVGGAVRDLLLKRPISDVDIATNIDINKLEARYKTDEIGKSKDFGIINVHWKGYEFEVANFRSERGSDDRRHPSTVSRVTSFEQDAARRDFSVNALGIDKNGVIYDYVKGLEDIKNNILRAVGDAKQRFTEDALRILRLFRQSSTLGFKIDPETFEAAKELKDLIDKLSVERVTEELYKAAKTGPTLAQYIEYLDSIGYLQKILPEVKQLQQFFHDPKHHPEGATVEEISQSI